MNVWNECRALTMTWQWKAQHSRLRITSDITYLCKYYLGALQEPHSSSPLGVGHSLVSVLWWGTCMCHLSGRLLVCVESHEHDAKSIYLFSISVGRRYWDIYLESKNDLKYTDKIDVMTSLRRVSWVLTSGDGWWPVARIQTPVPNVGSNVPGSWHPCYLYLSQASCPRKTRL